MCLVVIFHFLSLSISCLFPVFHLLSICCVFKPVFYPHPVTLPLQLVSLKSPALFSVASGLPSVFVLLFSFFVDFA